MDDDPLQEASSSLPAGSDIWCLFWQAVVNLSFIICYSYRLEQGTAVIRHSIRLHLPLLCIILARFLVFSLIVGSQNRDWDLDLTNCAAQEHAIVLGVNPLHGYRLCPQFVAGHLIQLIQIRKGGVFFNLSCLVLQNNKYSDDTVLHNGSIYILTQWVNRMLINEDQEGGSWRRKAPQHAYVFKPFLSTLRC